MRTKSKFCTGAQKLCVLAKQVVSSSSLFCYRIFRVRLCVCGKQSDRDILADAAKLSQVHFFRSVGRTFGCVFYIAVKDDRKARQHIRGHMMIAGEFRACVCVCVCGGAM